MDLQKQIFDCIAKSDTNELKIKFAEYTGSIDFTDDNGTINIYIRLIRVN